MIHEMAEYDERLGFSQDVHDLANELFSPLSLATLVLKTRYVAP